jgi:hypothetical protein
MLLRFMMPEGSASMRAAAMVAQGRLSLKRERGLRLWHNSVSSAPAAVWFSHGMRRVTTPAK